MGMGGEGEPSSLGRGQVKNGEGKGVVAAVAGCSCGGREGGGGSRGGYYGGWAVL